MSLTLPFDHEKYVSVNLILIPGRKYTDVGYGVIQKDQRVMTLFTDTLMNIYLKF